MTGRVRTSGRSRWSRSVARPTISVTNQAPKSANASGSDPNRSGSRPSASAPTSAHDGRPPVDRPAGRHLLFVVLGPARREPVGADAERKAGGTQQSDEGLHRVGGRLSVAGRRGRTAGRVGQPALAPASASSTRVACETPVAPRGANGRGLR